MKNVIKFLSELQRNNNREWFEAHKAEYKAVQSAFESFAAGLIDGIASFDDSVMGLTVKDCTYRIYRDVRFSKDKSPYKTHMGVYVCPGGKKSGNAGYYFHVEPKGDGLLGGHLMSAGLYMPDPAALKSVREDMLYNSDEFLSALSRADGFSIEGDSLKRVPLGYPADSPMAKYLMLKDVSLYRSLDDAFLLAPDLTGRLVAKFEKTFDLVRWLNRAVQFAREEM